MRRGKAIEQLCGQNFLCWDVTNAQECKVDIIIYNAAIEMSRKAALDTLIENGIQNVESRLKQSQLLFDYLLKFKCARNEHDAQVLKQCMFVFFSFCFFFFFFVYFGVVFFVCGCKNM